MRAEQRGPRREAWEGSPAALCSVASRKRLYPSELLSLQQYPHTRIMGQDM